MEGQVVICARVRKLKIIINKNIVNLITWCCWLSLCRQLLCTI